MTVANIYVYAIFMSEDLHRFVTMATHTWFETGF